MLLIFIRTYTMKKSIACLVVGVVMSMHSFGGNLTQTQFEKVAGDMMFNMLDSSKRADQALEKNNLKEFTKHQCRLLNILEDMQDIAKENKGLNKAYDLKLLADERLREENARMAEGGADKDSVCSYSVS